MNRVTAISAQTAKDYLKRQLIASISGGNAVVEEELKLLLKLQAPEQLRGCHSRI